MDDSPTTSHGVAGRVYFRRTFNKEQIELLLRRSYREFALATGLSLPTARRYGHLIRNGQSYAVKSRE